MVDWTIHYIKNRDLIRRDLASIEKDTDGFDVVVRFKERTQFITVAPILEKLDPLIDRMNETDAFGIVMLNTLKNFNLILENWTKLIKYQSLMLYFVNPFSKLDKKWLINPHVHSKICDDKALKNGLKSMFDMVTPLTEAEIQQKFK